MNTLLSLLSQIGIKRLYIFAGLMVLIVFLPTLILSVFRQGYAVKKRAWYIFFVLGVAFAIYSATLFLKESTALFWAFSALCAFSCVPLFLLPERTVRFEESHRNFVKYIDGQMKNSVVSKAPNREEVETLKPQEKPSVKENDLSRFELDFKHVKSVIERLDYYGLTPSDKKTVSDLENAICQAENGDCQPNTKSRINDGLSALLKIMSKYGV